MTTETKPFPLRVVLTVTTGRLLTEPKGDRDNGIGDLYELLNWMTDDELFTHQLPRAANECKPWLLRWFPELERYGSVEALAGLDMLLVNHQGRDAIPAWLDGMAFIGGKPSYDVPRMPADDHERKHPYDELVAMRGTDEGIVIVETPE